MVDQKLYRNVLGQFVTGVVIVSSANEKGNISGLTVNAFSAVSLEPPLIMVCPQKTSSSYRDILDQGKFAVHILSESQEETAWAFAKKDVGLEGVNWHISEHGIPVLDEYLSLIECRVWKTYDGGDHDILVGEVIRMTSKETDNEPLIFHRGQMSALAVNAEA